MPSTDQWPKIGSFTVLRELGRGGMGVVYRAVAENGEPVAIKMMLSKLEDNEQAHRRFAREARLMEKVVSDHTVRILEVGEHEGQPFFAMEYLQGQSLEEYLKSGNMIPFEHVLRIAGEVAQGLADAHHQLVFHRDLKPDNIRLVSPNAVAKIVDFGLGREVETTSVLTRAGGQLGTPFYMSKEQFRGINVDRRTDLFSFGAVLYRMLCNNDQFRAIRSSPFWLQVLEEKLIPVHSLQPNLPDEFCQLVENLLADNPEVRPDLMSTVLPTIRRLRRNLPSKVEPILLSTPTNQSQPDLHVHPTPTTTMSAPAEGTRSIEPPPLDCTRPTGADATTVRRSQIDWARYLRVDAETDVDLGRGVKMSFVLIPPGRYLMGSQHEEVESQPDEKPLHMVNLTRPFFMGKYAVTQEEYVQLSGLKNPSYFKGEPRLPVECVSWNDAKQFWEFLEERSLPWGFPKASLPTESQWEYACRAGTRTVFHFGDVLKGIEANSNGNYPYGVTSKGRNLGKTCIVDNKDYVPNFFGLHQMHGNVWEWCLDGFDSNCYKETGRTDPCVPLLDNSRVLRGGSWFSFSRLCRSAYRGWNDADFRGTSLGFRLILSMD